MHQHNRNIEAMYRNGYRPTVNGEWIDSYNKSTRTDGVSGTILCGIDFRNMHFVAVTCEKPLTSH